MDPYVLLSLITSASSLLVSVMTHVKHSKCWNCEIETRDNVPAQPDEKRLLIPSQPEIQEEYIPRSRASSRVVFYDEKNTREEK